MHDFIMITGKKESKILTKDISCKCKSKFDYRLIQIKSRITINVGASVKNIIYVKKIIPGILLLAVVKVVDI